MSFLDLTLLVLLVLTAIGGWKRGLIAGVLSLLGFLVGGVASLQLAPTLLSSLGITGQLRIPASLLVVLTGASIMSNVAQYVGSGISKAIPLRLFRGLDRLGGVALNVISICFIVWFVANSLVTNTGLWQSQVNNSRVISTIDGLAPDTARTVISQFQGWLDNSGLPRVIAGIGVLPDLPVAPPSPDIGQIPVIAERAKSVVRIEGSARGCSGTLIGTGFVFAPTQVMTNAHVVAGMATPTVGVPGGEVFEATVVSIDTKTDVAILYVPGLNQEPIPFGNALQNGDDAVALGYAGGGPLVAVPARIRQTIDLLGSDIYGNGNIDRSVIVLRAEIEQGDSGGPLLNRDGEVVGMIFAEAASDPEMGFALALTEFLDDAQAHASSRQAIDVGVCAASR